MHRKRFLRGAVAAIAGGITMRPRAAAATGGLDVQTADAPHVMRVLLASGPVSAPEQVDSWHFLWNGKHYRGTFATVRLASGEDGLVNTLPIDAYLYGVLAREVSPSWPQASQQAQAIVSRTYALGKLKPLDAYDIVASESDQQYSGIAGESFQGRNAIDATAGTILTYAGMPAHVAYSSCCGGRTADAGDVWNTPYPYLPSIDDPHCSGSPGYEWQTNVALTAIQDAFPACADIGSLRSVDLTVTSTGARPKSISLVGTTSTFAITPKALRASVGASIVRSTFVRTATIQEGGASLALTGTGRGHGVGMCQWGAKAMADAGATANEIVSFYLPGTGFGRV